jgi:hypothetical protein
LPVRTVCGLTAANAASFLPTTSRAWQRVSSPVRAEYGTVLQNGYLDFRGARVQFAKAEEFAPNEAAEVELDVVSQKLRRALGQDTAAIHWDFARKALETATGVPTVVGLRARLDRAAASNAP